MKVAFATLGCRVNQYETEAMIEKFTGEAYEVVEFNDYADVYVINTCTVTNMGDKKSRQMIGRARRINDNSIIAVVGCYSQIAPEEVANIEGVDIVLGTRNKGEIIYWINRFIDERKTIIQVNDVLRNKQFEDLRIEEYRDRSRAFLKIQDGCNRFCSYCLIPYARGAVCSKDSKKILDEVKELAENGLKEITLSGIHIASYGDDLDNKMTLMDILEMIDEIDGVERIRIGSIDPTFFSEGVIERIAKLKKLCPHFHLSLQSGCDATLKRMNRKYTTEQYRDIVNKIRENIKDVAITTDIIVGFPGETNDEFNETHNFLKEIELAKMHIFKYSPRKGTRAAAMKDDVSGVVKEERSKILLKLNDINENAFINKFIGREMKVLYEQETVETKEWYEGYTPNYIKVITNSIEEISVGSIKNTIIENSKGNYAIGKLS